MKNIKLQAHKGVASECPENTLSAFRCAAAQGYSVAELDLEYTRDKKIVVLHDKYINRTARKEDGAELEEKVCINDITYDDALLYDFGIFFSKKYRGERLPLFEDVLRLAKDNGIRLKIDNKIQAFPEEILNLVLAQVREYADCVSMTSNSMEFIKRYVSKLPEIAIDYDGAVTEDILKELCNIVPDGKLTVWLPYKCKNTGWVKIPFADEKSAQLVKRYAKLGIWLLSDYESFYDAERRLAPDIVETDGKIKPILNKNKRYDMHTHSKASHDSECEVGNMRQAEQRRGVDGFAVTDHLDVEYFDTMPLDDIAEQSIAAAKAADKDGRIRVLHGMEIGEGFWHPEVTDRIIEKYNFDVIIGSVHAVKFKNCEIPYSRIDFSKMEYGTVLNYMDKYFDDMLSMLESCDIDVLAHLTCPLRYISGKYGIKVDLSRYEDKIKAILKYIIGHGIALEVNSSNVYDGSEYPEFMPNESIIKMYKDMGGYLITSGSDAHIAKNASNSFDELYACLAKMGFENVYYYKDRCPIQCTIE